MRKRKGEKGMKIEGWEQGIHTNCNTRTQRNKSTKLIKKLKEKTIQC